MVDLRIVSDNLSRQKKGIRELTVKSISDFRYGIWSVSKCAPILMNYNFCPHQTCSKLLQLQGKIDCNAHIIIFVPWQNQTRRKTAKANQKRWFPPLP
jgi:hypothetical protein